MFWCCWSDIKNIDLVLWSQQGLMSRSLSGWWRDVQPTALANAQPKTLHYPLSDYHCFRLSQPQQTITARHIIHVCECVPLYVDSANVDDFSFKFQTYGSHIVQKNIAKNLQNLFLTKFNKSVSMVLKVALQHFNK